MLMQSKYEGGCKVWGVIRHPRGGIFYEIQRLRHYLSKTRGGEFDARGGEFLDGADLIYEIQRPRHYLYRTRAGGFLSRGGNSIPPRDPTSANFYPFRYSLNLFNTFTRLILNLSAPRTQTCLSPTSSGSKNEILFFKKKIT